MIAPRCEAASGNNGCHLERSGSNKLGPQRFKLGRLGTAGGVDILAHIKFFATTPVCFVPYMKKSTALCIELRLACYIAMARRCTAKATLRWA